MAIGNLPMLLTIFNILTRRVTWLILYIGVIILVCKTRNIKAARAISVSGIRNLNAGVGIAG